MDSGKNEMNRDVCEHFNPSELCETCNNRIMTMHDFKNHHPSNATPKPVYTLPRALVDGIAIFWAEVALVALIAHVWLVQSTGSGLL